MTTVTPMPLFMQVTGWQGGATTVLTYSGDGICEFLSHSGGGVWMGWRVDDPRTVVAVSDSPQVQIEEATCSFTVMPTTGDPRVRQFFFSGKIKDMGASVGAVVHIAFHFDFEGWSRYNGNVGWLADPTTTLVTGLTRTVKKSDGSTIKTHHDDTFDYGADETFLTMTKTDAGWTYA
ncbi:MAG: hypothetical protein HQL66_03290 [Magnetococcales bacterium]|nr:hypothetical protein [Magnetococcales bacterium]